MSADLRIRMSRMKGSTPPICTAANLFCYLIKAPASSVALSAASYHNSSYSSISGISMGGVSQTTIQSPSDLTDEQLAEAFNRTRPQYLQERGGQNITAHSSRQIRSSPSINKPFHTPRHYRSARPTQHHVPADPLESIRRRQDELTAKRNTLAEEICQMLHEAVDLEFNMGQCDSQLAELKMEEDEMKEGLVSGTDLMRDGVQGATWDW
ncbi:hypothetical protein BKA59DRAFT_458709 [Fusarium tricinctum]|uniref:Uncharacterized protein n=1 Tax=Fusarium tricinctum TaxID=61284 RepID=A0A8K0RVQ6_9HYPO|nr:hypothetical protein BKA59DRAFT_458709 [Fusarium tricinctum]